MISAGTFGTIEGLMFWFDRKCKLTKPFVVLDRPFIHFFENGESWPNNSLDQLFNVFFHIVYVYLLRLILLSLVVLNILPFNLTVEGMKNKTPV